MYSGWLLKDRLPPRVFAGLIVSFAGAVVIGFPVPGKGAASIDGVLLCWAAAVSYACGVMTQKPALRHALALQVTTFACLVGAAVTRSKRRISLRPREKAPIPAEQSVPADSAGS